MRLPRVRLTLGTLLFTVAVVLLPKVIGLALAIGRTPRGLVRPGAASVFGGAFVEIIASILIAPILMLTQSQAVLEILLGKDSGWSAQRRDGASPELARVVRFHAAHQIIGVAFAVSCVLATMYVLAWMSPIILGLVLAPLI